MTEGETIQADPTKPNMQYSTPADMQEQVASRCEGEGFLKNQNTRKVLVFRAVYL